MGRWEVGCQPMIGFMALDARADWGPAHSTSSGRALRGRRDGGGRKTGGSGLGAGKGGSTQSCEDSGLAHHERFHRQGRGGFYGDSGPAHHERGGRLMRVARKTGGSEGGCFISRRISIFDELRTNVTGSGPFVVSLPNHEFAGLIDL